MMPRCFGRSRVMFSNTWGGIVFVELRRWRSGALFSDSPWPSVADLSISWSPVFAFWRSGALFSEARRSPVFGLGRRLGLPFGSPGPVGPG